MISVPQDNCDIQVLKNVHPEDIEDISERYLPYPGTELDSDSAKRIRILDIGSGNYTYTPGELDRIIKDSPGHVLDVIVKGMERLCFKIDVPKEERTQCVQRVRAQKMGYLFENMGHISLQEEHRKTEEQRRRAEEAEEKLWVAEETIKQLLAKDNRQPAKLM